MVLSWEKYLDCVTHFLSVSESISDDWRMVDQPGSKLEKLPENCYLKKTFIERYSVGERSEDGSFMLEEDMESDPSSLQDLSAIPSQALVWEYHILFSASYGVPVLYFNVRDLAGKLISLQDLWNTLNVPKETLQEKWSFVTQHEHPILLRPFFYLHPCKSFEFFKVAENSSVNPLVTWLSSISPIVHLKVSLEYCNFPFPNL